LANATRLCEANFGVLLLYEGARFRVAAAHNPPPAYAELRRRQPEIRSSGVLARSRATKQLLHITDCTEHPSYKQGDDDFVAFVDLCRVRTLLDAPMLKKGELIGIIALYRQEVRRFTDQQVELVRNFAAQAVIAIENARLLNELHQRTTDLSHRTAELTESLEQQTATSEVLQVISSSPGDLQPVFEANSAAALAAMAQQAAERMQGEFGLPLALIIIDAIVAAAGFSRSGEENDAALGQAIMRQLAKLAQLTGTFVLGIDHFGKAAEIGTRGSSAKEGAADTVLALLGDKAITGAVTATRMALRKSRAGASGQEFPFSVRLVDLGVDDNGRPSTSLVIDWLQAALKANAEGAGWSKSLRLLQRALMNVLVEHGRDQQPFSDGPVVRAVDVEVVRNEFYKSYAAAGDARQKQNAKRQAFNRAVRDAQERSLIGIREVGEATLIWLVRGEAAR
jgi:GAF domain/AAA domain